MKILRILIQTIITTIFAFAVFLIWATFSDYQPEKTEVIAENKSSNLQKDTISILIWNIGYAGLGADMDFFYDGGEKMQTTEGKTHKNLKYILEFLKSKKNIDFILLQEVDVASKRSYKINQKKKIKSEMKEKHWYFSSNYKVKFVPMPLGNPLGEVHSGLFCGSTHKPLKVTRHKFTGNYAWPKSLFMLDRCFTSMSFPLNNDTLFIVNTHNTAYDDGGLRAMQMNQIKQWMLKKHSNGNHVIIGGDWNQIPLSIEINQFGKQPKSKNYIPKKIPEKFLPKGWKIAFDESKPTNRGLDKPLNQDSFKTIIDYFLLSPNVKLINIHTINLEFKNSDHNPVWIRAVVK